MRRSRNPKRNSSPPYAASNRADSRLGRGPRGQPQPQPASSTPESHVQPVKMSVPDVTIPTPANQHIQVTATSGTVLPASSMLSSTIATNQSPLISVSENLGIHVP